MKACFCLQEQLIWDFNVNQVSIKVTPHWGSRLPGNGKGPLPSHYLVHTEGHGEPPEGGDGGEPAVLLKVLVQVGQVEELVKAAVLVGDDVKQKAAIFLVGVDVMKDHHWVRVKLGGQRLPGPLVNDMNVSLKAEAHPGVSSPCADMAQRQWVRTRPSHAVH